MEPFRVLLFPCTYHGWSTLECRYMHTKRLHTMPVWAISRTLRPVPVCLRRVDRRDPRGDRLRGGKYRRLADAKQWCSVSRNTRLRRSTYRRSKYRSISWRMP